MLNASLNSSTFSLIDEMFASSEGSLKRLWFIGEQEITIGASVSSAFWLEPIDTTFEALN